MMTSRPWCSAGTNGSGGAGVDVGDGRQLLRRRLGLGDEAGDGAGGRRQQQHPSDDLVEGVQAEPEPGGDAEVAAAADGPEQLGMVVGVDVEELAVGGDQLGGQQVVDRQAALDQQPDAAAQPADADRAGVAEPGGQPMRAGGGAVGAGGQAGLRPGGALLGVDLQGVHVGQIQHDPAVGGAVPGEAVAAAANGQLQPSRAPATPPGTRRWRWWAGR